MRYLRGTTELGLVYVPQSSGECVRFSGSDWDGDLEDRKSTSGYIFQMVGGSISWRSKKQGVVALTVLSTTEAEYVALASATQEALWIRQLMTELKGQPPETAMLIFEDTQSVIAMTKNPQYHGRSKYVPLSSTLFEIRCPRDLYKSPTILPLTC